MQMDPLLCSYHVFQNRSASQLLLLHLGILDLVIAGILLVTFLPSFFQVGAFQKERPAVKLTLIRFAGDLVRKHIMCLRRPVLGVTTHRCFVDGHFTQYRQVCDDRFAAPLRQVRLPVESRRRLGFLVDGRCLRSGDSFISTPSQLRRFRFRMRGES